MKTTRLITLVALLIIHSCQNRIGKDCDSKVIEVTATAYNSLEYQTSPNPQITAFGDSLKPGLNYIAVSRDLLDSGLVHNTKVKIEGFDELFVVKDKMNKRWRKRIDIYMGLDVDKAKNWGKKKVSIEFCSPEKDAMAN
ncbi:3D domain-containing protein [Winogradskyella aurantia]|uniref:3D domain-containing protein n=1 Tax=Winogradskyella aurantia TaxID=1915063 RepID=A0A265UT07_9FLAO|nr:3D domain-containing protein [Winogradskyella aurantia]OZV68444.1 hypothetical protein CA834_08165 [Winogradskyella aurantia]